jgi:transposase
MEVLHPRCAGLDIHRDTVVACARLVGDGGVEQHVETFGTTTSELERLSRWLAGHGVTHIAMEATGVYWKPVWAVLAADFELVLANAMHIKNVPGRKTDVNDAMWLADLLAHGLIRASFVPPVAMQALRDLTRGRKQLMREKASHVQRIDKTLQAANLKLGSVLSDIMGVSGRAIVEALAQRQTDPQVLADCVPIRARLRATRAEVTEALRGRRSDHQRLLLQIHLAQIAALEAAVARIDTEIGERLEPFRRATRQLITIPGVHELSAAVILAEIGVDMDRFPSAGHLISWAGLCPGNDESAGKRRSTKLRKGDPWLKILLVQVVLVAVRRKGSYLRALFHRLKIRRGPRKAIMAVAAAILTAIYWMLKRGVAYADLGADHFDRTERARLAARLTRKLDELGYHVTITDRQAA